ncbi:helix-turn-helix transcriptional regulator [Thermogemmatispora sp.]|uniref:helix-turn-helix transcriptional regulator n=1 Tax=Thermogemmatispora sp. TaxID=1968838 RepID=UPI0035E3FAF6
MKPHYWWRRYGDYPAGKCNLPHMGTVLREYRLRRGWSQEELAQASGVEKRTVLYWEAAMYVADPERRIMLARFLQIPPALLGLAWEQVVYIGEQGGPGSGYERLAEVVSTESYYHYEDLLLLARQLLYAGQLRCLTKRLPRWLAKLRLKIRDVPASDRTAWLWLLGHYLLLGSSLARHWKPDENGGLALSLARELFGLGQELEEPTLIGLALYRLMDLYRETGEDQQAEGVAREGLRWAGRVGPALRGNLYLRAAMVLASLGQEEEPQWRRWQEEALKLAERVEGGEGDASLLKLNRVAVHHERAKLLVLMGEKTGGKGKLAEAYRELAQAGEGLGSELGTWRMYLELTEARLFLVRGELEQSAWQGVKAWEAAQEMGSKKIEGELRQLYGSLKAKAAGNAMVQRLGLALAIC